MHSTLHAVHRVPATILTPGRFVQLLDAARRRRGQLIDAPDLTAYRLLDGAGDGAAGLYLDRYGPALVMQVYEDARLSDAAITSAARTAFELTAPSGVESVYVKRFVRDRSRLGGQAPDESRAAGPRVGRRQPETLVVREHGSRFEVRLYDGFSTGLFLEHRDHREALAKLQPGRVLNLFAYTCAFAVPLARAGAQVTNVDVSSRYLQWGERNLVLNGIAPAASRFFRMGAFEFLAYAARHAEERFDLVILDPPTFAAGDRRRGVQPWKAVEDYPTLVQAAAQILTPDGLVFAASNTRELATDDRLARLIQNALGAAPAWRPLPLRPTDLTETDRLAALLFAP